MKNDEDTEVRKYLNYQNMFWLFMIGNVAGCLLEGVWTVYKFGRWESHVNTIWGPFCMIYGVGGVAFYITGVFIHKKNIFIKFIYFALVSDLIEYFCAWMLEAGLGMKAWTYKTQFMNLQGRISLQITLIWGVMGLIYYYFLIPRINALFQKMKGKGWRVSCIIFTIFMAVNIMVTILCIIRWSERHNGREPEGQIEQVLDKKYDDEFMKKRFCEWWFIDEENKFWAEYKKR